MCRVHGEWTPAVGTPTERRKGPRITCSIDVAPCAQKPEFPIIFLTLRILYSTAYIFVNLFWFMKRCYKRSRTVIPARTLQLIALQPKRRDLVLYFRAYSLALARLRLSRFAVPSSRKPSKRNSPRVYCGTDMLNEQERWALALSTFAGLSTTIGALVAVSCYLWLNYWSNDANDVIIPVKMYVHNFWLEKFLSFWRLYDGLMTSCLPFY